MRKLILLIFITALHLSFVGMAVSDTYIPATEDQLIKSSQCILVGEVMTVEKVKWRMPILDENGIKTSFYTPLNETQVKLRVSILLKGSVSDSIITLHISSNVWRSMDKMQITKIVRPKRKVLAHVFIDPLQQLSTPVNGVYAVVGDTVYIYRCLSTDQPVAPSRGISLENYKWMIQKETEPGIE
jgi:hypothetical protein